MTTPTQIAYNVGAGNVTLPHPSSFTMTQLFHGAGTKMADGSINWDLISNTVKHKFQIEWTALSDANIAIVKTFFAAIKNTTCTFIDPSNTSHTLVNRQPGTDLTITYRLANSGNMIYDASATLVQE